MSCILRLYLFMWFFFFKQKTAYELRISDWSSDVCSSDLAVTCVNGEKLVAKVSADPYALETERIILQHLHQHDIPCIPRIAMQQDELGSQVRAIDRKSVV